MRLPLIAPADLTPEPRLLYDDMRRGIAGHFSAFKVAREDGVLMGPWNPWLREPAIGKAIWDQRLGLTASAEIFDLACAFRRGGVLPAPPYRLDGPPLRTVRVAQLSAHQNCECDPQTASFEGPL